MLIWVGSMVWGDGELEAKWCVFFFGIFSYFSMFPVILPEKPASSLAATLPETNSSPLKMDGWNTIISYWGPAYFQGLLLLVSGRVIFFKILVAITFPVLI